MVLNEITCDPRLRHVDVRIYNLLAGSRRGCFATIGERRISALAHADRRSVREGVRRLETSGYLKIIDKGIPGRRSRYKLTANLFGTTQKGAIGAELGHVDIAKEAVQAPPTKICPRCHERRRQILKVGYCRTCKSNDKFDRGVRRIAREEIAKAEVA